MKRILVGAAGYTLGLVAIGLVGFIAVIRFVWWLDDRRNGR